MNRKSLAVVLDFVAVIVIFALANLLGHAPWYEILNSCTDAFITCAALLVVDDFVLKLVKKQRAYITKSYVFGEIIFCSAIVFFASAYMCDKVDVKFFIYLALSFVLTGFGTWWFVSLLPKKDWVCVELKRRQWKLLKKKFPGKTEEEVRKEMETFLTYYLIGDRIEGGLDVSRPFDPEKPRTLAELKEENPNASTTNKIATYIATMAHNYVIVRDSQKDTQEAK